LSSLAEIRHEGAFRFTLQGDMSFASARSLLQQSQALFPAGGDFSLDLSAVQHSDSAGVALLLEWLAAAQAGGGRLEITGLPASMRAIAGVCNLQELLPLDEEE
jgi:phospholipid transport system transporter-binding protein